MSDPKTPPEITVTSDPETLPETAVTSDPETSPETTVTGDPETSPETTVTSDPETSPEIIVTSDPEPSPEITVMRRRRRRRPWLWLLLLMVLVLLVLAGVVVRYGWPPRYSGQQAQQTQQMQQMQQMQQQFQALHSEVAKAQDAVQSLRHDLATATASVDSNHKAISTLDQNIKGLQDSVGHLRNQISGSSQRVQLGAVERLLLLANDEIQLAHDPVTADHALAAADRRLAALDSPRLFALRKAIAQERTVLKAVDEPDLTATALTLTQLIEQIPQLPLRTQPYAIKQELPAPTAEHTQSQGGSEPSWQHIGIALRSLFHLRRTDRPIEPMLTQAQATLAGQVLSLRLDTARTALVQRNTQLYRSALDSAQHGLKRYYRVDAPSVRDQLNQLTKLSTLELNPTLPDISYSIDLLRALRDHPPS